MDRGRGREPETGLLTFRLLTLVASFKKPMNIKSTPAATLRHTAAVFTPAHHPPAPADPDLMIVND